MIKDGSLGVGGQFITNLHNLTFVILKLHKVTHPSSLIKRLYTTITHFKKLESAYNIRILFIIVVAVINYNTTY